MTIHTLKKCSFTDNKTGKQVEFYKVLYETKNDIGVAVLKCSDDNLECLSKSDYPLTLDDEEGLYGYDLQRIPGKTARLYIY